MITRLPHTNVKPWRNPRCEAKVGLATARWRDHAGKDDRCELKALYDLDGRHLCQRHAGDVLISRALTEKGETP